MRRTVLHFRDMAIKSRHLTLTAAAVGLCLAARIHAQTSVESCKFNSLPACSTPNLPASSQAAQVVFLPSLAFEPQQVADVLEAASASGSLLSMSDSTLNYYLKNEKCDAACRAKIEKHKAATVRDIPTALIPRAKTGYHRDEYYAGRAGNGPQVWTANIDQPSTFQVCGETVKAVPFQFRSTDGIGINTNSERGGNVLVLPGGTCVVGRFASDGFAKDLCGESAKILRLRVEGAKLPHVDNIMGVVPVPGEKPPCNFRVLMGSNDSMTAHLKANPQAKFFENAGSLRVNGHKRDNPYWEICRPAHRLRVFRKLKARLFPANEGPGTSGSKTQARLQTAGGGRAPAGAGKFDPAVNNMEDVRKYPEIADAIEEIGQISQKSDSALCENVTNAEILALQDADSELAPLFKHLEDHPGKGRVRKNADVLLSFLKSTTANGNSARAFQEMQNDNWKEIQKALPSDCRAVAEKMKIDVPMLFRNHNSVNPNPTNSQVIGDLAIVPMQPNPGLSQAVAEAYKKAGLRTTEVNSFDAHAGMGNVHCKSNEMRFCK